MRSISLILLLLCTAHLFAQKKTEQGFDVFFKPTDYAPRYYVVTEKQDTLWHRQAYYLPERGIAMEGWYKDKDCKTAQGTVVWYHPNKILKSKVAYDNGTKTGTWLEFDEAGNMIDSANYVAGKLKGVRMHWYANGMSADSMNFDGAGNGVEVRWYDDGNISAAGYWTADTVKKGRWKYYDPNGKVIATEDYVDGKRIACHCFDITGQPLSAAACSEEEASFPGGMGAWTRFIQHNMQPWVPVHNNAPLGQYTVAVQFVVDTSGHVTDIKPLTHFGYGMEEEVVRMLQSSPRWIPAHQFGRKVKAYRKQPITFVVSKS